MKDQYKTIADLSIGEFKDRGSKFIAYAYPSYQESDWQEAMEAVKKEHFKARHHCFAYRIGLDKNNFRANDDGEPSGTAGRPILGQIDSYELTNVFIVVVRYFGGTKLGASGLINAYRNAAKDALDQAVIIEKTVEDIYKLEFDYSLMSNVMNAVKKLDLEIVTQEFGHEAYLKVAIAQSSVDETLRVLRSQIAKVRIEEIDDYGDIEGLEMVFEYTR